MKLIAKNDEVILFFSNNQSLISSKINSITIQIINNLLCVGLTIELMYSKNYKRLFLEFEVIKEYTFSYSSNMSFYYIERYTFFKQGCCYYISFDPVSDVFENRNEHDNDFILSEGVSLYQIDL